MSHTDDVAARHMALDTSALIHEHPRGRGFSILSRLAREREIPATTAAPVPTAAPETEPVEWRAKVIPFDRAEPAPRHRRDDTDLESARRSS
jgi:hypothetical protein